jgi:hypothetical protein
VASVGAFGVQLLFGAFGSGAFGGSEGGDGVQLGLMAVGEGVSFASGVGADAVGFGAGVGFGLAGTAGFSVGAVSGLDGVVAFADGPVGLGPGRGDGSGGFVLGGGDWAAASRRACSSAVWAVRAAVWAASAATRGGGTRPSAGQAADGGNHAPRPASPTGRGRSGASMSAWRRSWARKSGTNQSAGRPSPRTYWDCPESSSSGYYTPNASPDDLAHPRSLATAGSTNQPENYRRPERDCLT